MANIPLIPSVEERLRGLIEVGRRNLREHTLGEDERRYPTVTLAREFGCEGYPVAEALKPVLEKRSGQQWVIMDRALLDAAAANHNLSSEIFENLGNKNRFLDDFFSTFSSRWKSDRDYFRLLTRQIVALAHGGNVILVGRGASIVTQDIGNCFHFRIVAPMSFKVSSISRRMEISEYQAHELVESRQRQRDAFLKDFLGRDVAEPTLYHLIFNNARCSTARIATLIADVVMPQQPA